MKYQTVLQHSEEDCGAACLATVAKHHGRTFAISRVREAVGTGSRGTSLLGLRRGAEALGFNARQVRATPQLIDKLNEVPLPAVIHWKGYHWVVLYGQKRRKYVIADPGVGIRYLDREELIEGWGNGIMLLLEPDDSRFNQQPDDRVGGMGRYFKRVWPYRFILAQAIAINFAVGLLSLVSPLMMQLLTDDVLVRGDTQLLTTIAIGAIARQQIAQEQAAGEATLAKLNQEKQALLQQHIEISKQLERDSRELQQVETDLGQTIISAPTNGILFKLNLRNSSQTVQPGEEIAQIAPSDVPLRVKAAVSPQDVGKLKEGQKVQMRVSACPYPDYGTLKGVVSQIAGDTLKPQGDSATATTTASNPKGGLATAFYEVTIEPKSLSLGRDNIGSVQLGMEGRADIVSREETVLKFLLRKARLITDL